MTIDDIILSLIYLIAAWSLMGSMLGSLRIIAGSDDEQRTSRIFLQSIYSILFAILIAIILYGNAIIDNLTHLRHAIPSSDLTNMSAKWILQHL